MRWFTAERGGTDFPVDGRATATANIRSKLTANPTAALVKEVGGGWTEFAGKWPFPRGLRSVGVRLGEMESSYICLIS